jgi:hypothetical protein
MAQSHRVIIAGTDKAGKSVVTEDQAPLMCVMVGGK